MQTNYHNGYPRRTELGEEEGAFIFLLYILYIFLLFGLVFFFFFFFLPEACIAFIKARTAIKELSF